MFQEHQVASVDHDGTGNVEKTTDQTKKAETGAATCLKTHFV